MTKILRHMKDGKLVVPGVIQDGLVLFYDFSNESNTSEYREKAFDYSGNGNHQHEYITGEKILY